MRDIGCLQPIVNCLLNPRGHGHSPNVTCLAYQINDGPMAEVIRLSELRRSSPSGPRCAPKSTAGTRDDPGHRKPKFLVVAFMHRPIATDVFI
jgi:hypothetical protein